MTDFSGLIIVGDIRVDGTSNKLSFETFQRKNVTFHIQVKCSGKLYLFMFPYCFYSKYQLLILD